MAEETDVDFSQVKKVKIKDGEVRYITEGETKLLWLRPFEFPTMSFAVYYQQDTTHNFACHSYLVDKCTTSYEKAISVSGKNSTNSDDTKNNFVLLNHIWLPSKGQTVNELSGYTTAEVNAIPEGLKTKLGLVAFKIDNKTKVDSFPLDCSSLYGASTFGYYYALYSFSDAFTKKIKLFAVKDTTRPNRYFVKGDGLQRRPITGELYHEEITRDTDVEVEASEPLITLGNKTYVKAFKNLNFMPFVSIRDNFDEYKIKYDTATGSKYPKSEYPYLVGGTKLTAELRSSSSNGAQTWGKDVDGTYFYFIVKR